MNYRPDIDGLRAVAVVPVVLNHAGLPGFSGGFVGVDVFFVISGFLITSILADELDRGHFSLPAFYERRVRRILPALFAMLAVCLVVGVFRFLPGPLETLASGAMATLLFVSNIWFWTEATDYFSQGAEFNPLLHTWSLAVEEQFYVVFPVLLWLLMTRARRWTVPAILGLTVLSFLAAVYKTGTAPDAAFYLSPYRFWELSIGSLLALFVVRQSVPNVVRDAAGLLGLVAIAIAVTVFDSSTRFPGTAALLPCLGAALVIWAGQCGPNAASRLLSVPPLVWVGLISYSLYLWHWPVLAYLRIQGGTIEIAPMSAAVAVVVSIGLAWVSWHFVERPIRRRDRISSTRRACFVVAGVSGLALFSVATVLDQTDGLPSRLPPDVQALYDEIDWSRMPRHCADADFRKPDCATGEGELDLLLWGDSHAGAAWPAFAEAAPARGLTASVAWGQACPPLLGIMRATGDMGGPTCAAQNDRVIEQLIEQPVLYVVLHARWPLVAEGTRYGGEAGPDTVSFVDLERSGVSLNPDENAQLFERSLLRTVAAIRSTGSEVILLSGVPEIGWMVRDAVTAAQFSGGSIPRLPNLEDVESRHRLVNAVLRALAEQDGVHLIEVADAICTPDCPVIRDGRLLYRDDDHLSSYGAHTLLVPLLTDQLP